MAKAPVPGRVKTRLCPPLSLAQAAVVAEAALADTLAAVARCGAERRILALDGAPGDWLPSGFCVIEQRGDNLAQRLAAAWADAGGPGVQIGMDTPQVTPQLLDICLAAVSDGRGPSAALGLADDGGWWALALASGWEVDVFRRVPMSTPVTGAAQLASLKAHGHDVALLPRLRDIDYAPDAAAVAAEIPGSAFAAAWRESRAKAS